jgi:Short C-terminal domain
MCAHLAAGYHRAMLLRPLRRTPMMLGGVGFQAGLDEVRRKQIEAQRHAAVATHATRAPVPNVVEQLKDLKALLDDGVLSPEEFQRAKRKVLDG